MQEKNEKEIMIGAQAINKFFYWSMNYDGSLKWIHEIWEGFMGDHMLAKFENAYNNYGSMGVIPAFYGELDNENRLRLIQWVDKNYHNEIEL